MELLNTYFKNILTLLLFGCFIYTCFDSLEKFNHKSVSVTYSERKSYKIPYPSITICPSAATKTRVHLTMFNLSNTFEDMKEIYTSNVWSRNESVYFLNQKSGLHDGFPCMTSSEDLFDPGKPCAFPFFLSKFNMRWMIGIWKCLDFSNASFSNCTNFNAGKEHEWCGTRVNSSRALMFDLQRSKGTCSSACKGAMMYWDLGLSVFFWLEK